MFFKTLCQKSWSVLKVFLDGSFRLYRHVRTVMKSWFYHIHLNMCVFVCVGGVMLARKLKIKQNKKMSSICLFASNWTTAAHYAFACPTPPYIQLVQNAAARLLTGIRRRDHITQYWPLSTGFLFITWSILNLDFFYLFMAWPLSCWLPMLLPEERGPALSLFYKILRLYLFLFLYILWPQQPTLIRQTSWAGSRTQNNHRAKASDNEVPLITTVPCNTLRLITALW